MGRFIDLSGRKVGRLTVFRPTEKRNTSGSVVWECHCECGKTVLVASSALNDGSIQSCGCLQREAVRRSNTTHGLSYKKIYKVWEGMKGRCENPNNKAFPNYGGRGINICPEWQEPDRFCEWAYATGYSEIQGLSIERIDNDKGYSPGNCRWATKKEQQNNRRVNHTVTAYGETKTATEWGECLGIKPNTIICRLRKGLTGEDALAPVTS